MAVALRPLVRVLLIVCAAGVGVTGAGCARSGARAGWSRELSEPTVAAGLEEALRVGAERSASRAAHPGGFLEDPRVRIALPAELANLGAGLRSLGFSSAVDDLERALNRAAERAARDFQGPLVSAIAGLEIDDPRAVLAGPDDAATELLRRERGAALRERLGPIAVSAARGAGVAGAFQELRSRNRALGLVADPHVDLNSYVADETLAGLFALMREEEQRIRRDPAARTTDLLREVFGEP